MPANLGNLDRIVRALAGLALIALAFVGPRSAWGLLGFVPLLTAFVGYCPLYSLIGLDTRPGRGSKSH